MVHWRPAIAGVFAAAAVCACRPAKPAAEAVVRLGPAPVLTCKADPVFRWLDAANHPYSEEFRKSFSYAKAEVVLRFERRGPVFRGRLTARRLKPNFVYQIKLVGLPPVLWLEKADAAANRRIGEVGRWWRPGKEAGNAYFFEPEKDADNLEAYLVFGYFATDADGNADVPFALDSSYHVLWKTSQWPPSKDDSKPTRHEIVAEAGRCGYDRSFPAEAFELYAEAQYGRPPLGAVRLAPGQYRCFFLLTEESFHAWGGEGGDWAAALAAEIEFTITPGAAAGQPADAKSKMPDARPEPTPQAD